MSDSMDRLGVKGIAKFLRGERIDDRVSAWQSPMRQTVGYRHEATALEREYDQDDVRDRDLRRRPAIRFAQEVYAIETAAERQALNEYQEPHCLAMRSGGWMRLWA